jgi:hypothetical protein
LQTNSNKLEYASQDLDIKPGMTVKVNILSGEKTIFDYLMKPILKSRQIGKARGHDRPDSAAGSGELSGGESVPSASSGPTANIAQGGSRP